MKETERLVDELLTKAESYGYSSVELAKLKSVKAAAKATGKIGGHFVLWAVITMCLLMASIAVAIWLGQLWGELYLGFAAVAGFYLIVALMMKAFKVPLVERPIENCVVRNILD